ncbi:uncharacterized protein TNCT_32181 [Trichonephila clavata]|uniref:Uncharacterized protein n=1 Tax=Trichonephila clavata TaxID=2740835 RepID=A0A8X6JCS2_TRICU|nr:uncharacterized protein TNCT_32181 [Trichonephila clavata]
MSISGLSISFNSELDDVATTVLLEKPTEGISTAIAVKDSVDHVCMELLRAENHQYLYFFKNVSDKSSYDLGNFSNKILNDYEKRQIIDMGPSGPFLKDMH